jgi:hypothetical protein
VSELSADKTLKLEFSSETRRNEYPELASIAGHRSFENIICIRNVTLLRDTILFNGSNENNAAKSPVSGE